MQRFQNILCCVNDPGQPDPALDRAVALAKSNGASLTLVDADHTGIHFWQSESVQKAINKARLKRLDKIAGKLKTAGVDVLAGLLEGNPASSIIETVQSGDHDLVMKTSRAEGLATRLFFGETAIRLMRRCPCPVWVVQPQHAQFRRILVAVDVLAQDILRLSLNRQLVEMASSLAETEQCELHLAYVIPEFRDSSLVSQEYSERLIRLRHDTLLEATTGLEELLKTTGTQLPGKHVHQLTGVPGEALAAFARRQSIDLITMGTVVRSGVDGFAIGNTAEKVLHSVECSVLAVKPTESDSGG